MYFDVIVNHHAIQPVRLRIGFINKSESESESKGYAIGSVFSLDDYNSNS